MKIATRKLAVAILLLAMGGAAASAAAEHAEGTIRAADLATELHHARASTRSDAAGCLYLYLAEEPFTEDPAGMHYPSDPRYSGAWAQVATAGPRLHSLELFFSGRQLTVPEDDLSSLTIEIERGDDGLVRGRLRADDVALRFGLPTLAADVSFAVTPREVASPASAGSTCDEGDAECLALEAQRAALVREMEVLEGGATETPPQGACP